MSNTQYQDFKQENNDSIPVGIPVGTQQGYNQSQGPLSSNHQQPNHQGFSPNFPNQQPQMYRAPPALQNHDVYYQNPIHMNCPCCLMNINTLVNYEPGNTTFIWAGSIFAASCLSGLIGCCCWSCATPLCCIPFCQKSCLDKNHYCPNCGFNILRKHQSCCDFV